MSTITAAVETTLARRDADELAALRAQLAAEREANAKWHRENECKGADELHCPCVPDLRADLATAAEVTARLTEERDAALSHQRALVNERDKWIEGWKRVAGERAAEKAAHAATLATLTQERRCHDEFIHRAERAEAQVERLTALGRELEHVVSPLIGVARINDSPNLRAMGDRCCAPTHEFLQALKETKP